MLPENRNAVHLTKCRLSLKDCTKPVLICHKCARGKCSSLCPACAVVARDKEWAKWIVHHYNGLTFTVSSKAKEVSICECLAMPIADFEALKKLAEE